MNFQQLAISIVINHNRHRLSIGRINIPAATGLIEQDPINRNSSRRRPFCGGPGARSGPCAAAATRDGPSGRASAGIAEPHCPKNVVLQQIGARQHGERNSQRSVRGTRAQTGQGFAFNHPGIAAGRPAGERRTGIASQQSLLIAPLAFQPHSDLSIFQKIGVAGPSSTPDSDFRQALGARYCPSGT
jgi:hypothetical protein